MAYSTTFNLNRPNRLLVFGVSANQNLNLRDYQITEAGSNLTPTTATNTDSLTPGNVAVPGSILAIPFAGWTRAYSFIAHKGEGDKLSMELAMVSPVHSWLDQQSSQGLAEDKKSQTGHTALAGCSDGQDVASLFYIKDSTLQELALNTTSNNNGEPTPIETVKLATKTQLAATAGTNKKRYVAYQLANDGRIEVYHLEKSTPMAKLKSTTDSIDGSPLAIVQFEKGGQSYVRLYYVKEFRDKSRKVVRAQQTLDSEGMSIGDWAYVEMEQSGKHPSTSTSLSAIWVPSVQQVILTYHATGQTGLTSFWDKDTWPLGG